MKERTLDAIEHAEAYFTAVIEQEADGAVVPSRTEELHWAVEGLEGIAYVKYKEILKDCIEEDRLTKATSHPEMIGFKSKTV